jgi:hypothetical protein
MVFVLLTKTNGENVVVNLDLIIKFEDYNDGETCMIVYD